MYYSPIGDVMRRISAEPLDPDTTTNRWTTQVILGSSGFLYFNKDEANEFARILLEHLYDNDLLDMRTAERINYLTHVVLRDAEEYRSSMALEAQDGSDDEFHGEVPF